MKQSMIPIKTSSPTGPEKRPVEVDPGEYSTKPEVDYGEIPTDPIDPLEVPDTPPLPEIPPETFPEIPPDIS